jgi:hypothetical protein
VLPRREDDLGQLHAAPAAWGIGVAVSRFELNMANIEGVLARVFVSDLDAAIPLYQRLADSTEVIRFAFRDMQLARIGPFLLLAGNTAAYRGRVATIPPASCRRSSTPSKAQAARSSKAPHPRRMALA